MLDHLLDAVVAMDYDGLVIYMNREAERLSGKSMKDDRPLRLGDIFPAATDPSVQAVLARVRAGGTSEKTTFYGRRVGKWLEVQILPLAEGIGCLFRDVTEQRDLESALKSSDQRFSRFMQHLPGLAWIKDLAGRYIYANDAALGAFGCTEQELYGRRDDEVFPSDTAAQFQQNDQSAIAGLKGIRTLERLEHADRTAHTSLVSKFPIPGLDGAVAMIGGIAIDVTDREQAEEALRESEARFRELANCMPAIVWMSGPSDGPMFLNRWYYEYSGEPIGTPGREGWAHVVHPEDRKDAFENWVRCNEAGIAWEQQLRLRRADGEYRWFLSRCVPIADDDGNVRQWLGTSVDVHDRKLIEEELEKRVLERTAQLEAAIAELEGFTYSVSHDLRGPVRNIVATSRMLQEDHGDSLSREANELLEGQARSALKLGDLIDQLLKLSRVARYDLSVEKLDLSAMANEIKSELLSKTWPVPLSIEVADGLTASGDPRLLRLVLQNLIENACKFSPAGGRITVGRENKAFFVRDEGVGFDPAYIDKLFRPFERLVRDDEFPGTGIGLANVARIVKRHGGRVWAESQLGKGATFFFTLTHAELI